MRRYSYPLLMIAVISCLLILGATEALAGITLDGSFGTKGALTGPNYSIPASVGQQSGSNLFHSFGIFNLTSAESATFTGPVSIQNIISRVTGGQSSSIDGKISSTINGANLYFINPAGIVFGPNATLDVSGSFHASTADYIKLSDSGRFDAATPTNSVLTTAAPSAFGFLGDPPKGITVNGSSLQVNSGSALSFVGGKLNFNGASIYAPSGTISLISAASSGETTLSNSGWDVSSFGKLGNISATNNSLIDTSGGGGIVYIRGGQFVLDNSSVRSRATGNISGGLIDINVRDEIDVINDASVSGSTYSDGNASDISINSDSFNLTSGGYIAASSSGSGKGGSIRLNARKFVISGGGSIIDNAYSSGQGGNVTISSKDSISISDDSSGIFAQSQGSGSAGTISVNAGKLLMAGGGSIDSSAYSSGSGGNISIETNNLSVTDGGNIHTGTDAGSIGNSGDLSIKSSDSISISGCYTDGSNTYVSNISSNTWGAGRGGRISIETGKLSIAVGGAIQAVTASVNSGNSGDISIKADDSVSISGCYTNGSNVYVSNISTNTWGAGRGGRMSIQTGNLSIADGGVISTVAVSGSSGDVGDISIKATDTVSISGYYTNGSDLYSSVINSNTFGTGRSGNISIETGKMFITDGGSIEAGASSTSGDSGNISIKASDTISISGCIVNGSSIYRSALSTDTWGRGNGGSISVETGKLSITDGGSIEAGAATGSSGNAGDINIKAIDSISISGVSANGSDVNRSFIGSNTFGKGKGGSISIDTGVLSLTNGGAVEAGAASGSSGSAGDINIKAADSISIGGYYSNGTDSIKSSSIYADTYGSGNAGSIIIDTSKMSLYDLGEISTSARAGSEGNGGNISIKATDSISVTGHYNIRGNDYNSGIFSDTFSTGSAGDISIETAKLSLSDLGTINTSAREGSIGNGGSISIKARDSISISGYYNTSGSGIFSETDGTGSAGDISIETVKLSLSDVGTISTSAREGSAGNSGNISIKASDAISISGHYDSGTGVYSSGIFSNTYGKGNAGSISIETAKLSIANSGTISTSVWEGSEGNGGSISIKAIDSISVSGHYDIGDTHHTSGIFSETGSKGRAGSITVESGSISLYDEGRISTSTSGTGAGGEIEVNVKQIKLDSGSSIASESTGTGVAGSITIKAGNAIKITESSITTATADADGGNISVDPQLMDIRNSSITATVRGGTGNGGNIVLNSEQVVLEGSRIIANADKGNGGSIDIKSNVFIKTSDSTVSASSNFGLQGTVEISAPLVDLSGNLTALPAAFIDTGALFPKPCAQREEDMSSFVVKGKDGAPPQPDAPLGNRFCPGDTGR
ncbi:MAG: filamentous hemagglutinin N-terminal domain-containing protein [Nitrospirae bacterium]|nr:filamentous hemagglutinin N-terminal domain-containing protein [Nitrospirota bacterium]